MPESWKKLRHRIEAALCRFAAWFAPRLPGPLAAQLADALGWLAYHLDSHGRAVALANLDAVFGEEFSATRKNDIARKSFQTFARAMIDLFRGEILVRENWRSHIHLEAGPLARWRAEHAGSGGIFITPHAGSFEWGYLAVPLFDGGGAGVTAAFKNPLLTDLFARLRGVTSSEMLPQERSMIRMLKRVKQGQNVGMLIDLNLKPDQASTIMECFGMEICATFIHAILHERTGAPVFPFEALPLPDGTCRLIIHEPLVFPAGATHREIAQACWDFYEPRLRAHPERWLWAYKHWRYKPLDAARPYPFYANASKKFERLRRSVELEKPRTA